MQNRKLYLLRHGKSDWETDVDDFHRPLKNRGKRGAQKIGLWLAQHKQVPDYVICSSAVRAFTTAEKACKVAGFDYRRIDCQESAYMASPDELIDIIRSVSADVERLLLVGHNPGLEQLLELLAKQQVKIPDDGKVLPTSAMAIVNIEAEWENISANQAQLVDIVYAKDFPDRFPFPELDSNELRERPAYYYYQSSVIPYLIENGELTLLIVKSSSGKRWVFPKGIIDPQLSPQLSAEKEAFEEAGVKGQIDYTSLGDYTAKKWGGKCHVLVYSMEITTVIPEKEWKEKHRKRKWIKLDQVAEYIENSDILELVKLLENKILKVH